jgi:siroheme synthase-like protein
MIYFAASDGLKPTILIETAPVKVNPDAADSNRLFPVFLKLETLSVLIIGGGNVALEKLHAVLNNSPATTVTVLALAVSERIRALAALHPGVAVRQKAYEAIDLAGADILIVAVNDLPLCEQIKTDAAERGLLVNVADTPLLCDFYLGSVVQKGNLKIAVSTNGKSPTIAKRVREVLNEMIPAEIDGVLYDMQHIRQNINGNFSDKVRQLNDLTKVLVAKQATLEDISLQKPKEKKWQQIVKWCLFAFVFMIIGHTLFSLIPSAQVVDAIRSVPDYIDTRSFLIMLLTGFMAQMVDGSLGMGYGTISTTFLLANGVSPAVVSSRVHSARVFSSGVSGYSHHRFGNINKKLFKTLVVPGILGSHSRGIAGVCGPEIFNLCTAPARYLHNVSRVFYHQESAAQKKGPG